VRVSADPTSPYEIVGEDGPYQGSIQVSFDSARAILATLHGSGKPLSDSTHAPGTPFFDFEVERQAMPRPGQTAARYPKGAYQQHESGEVLAQVIVDTTGHTDMSKFRILHTTDQLFSDAVREAIVTERFFPAERDGHLVSEIVQQPFRFRAP